MIVEILERLDSVIKSGGGQTDEIQIRFLCNQILLGIYNPECVSFLKNILLVDFEKFIFTLSCLYFYYYKGRCYSITYHLKCRDEYYKLI